MEIILFIIGFVIGFTFIRYALNPRRTLKRISNGAYLFKPILAGIVLGFILSFLGALIFGNTA
ncbi:MAG: hypothetical protein JW395_1307 [Nitrospira sp.]|jgi:hypothetical protein|nr:hypothetical protein [Nitrospira sp.]